MPISSITMKKVATYDEKGVDITEIQKLSFFVGSNGTGKSTIAKVLRDKSLTPDKQNPEYKDCSITGFESSNEEILVYDEIFKEKNFVDNPNLKGVFSLNEKNKEVEKGIEAIEKEVKRLNDNKKILENRETKIGKEIERRFSDLKNFCWRYRREFEDFKDHLKLPHAKESYLQKLQKYANEQPPFGQVQFSQLFDDHKALFLTNLEKIGISFTSEQIEGIVSVGKRIAELLKKPIISKESIDIPQLIEDLGIDSWKQERKSIEGTGKCPYCDQTIHNKEDLISRIDSHFDKAYQESVEEIKTENKSFTSAVDNIVESLKKLKESAVKEKSTQCLLELRDESESIKNAVNNKLSQPGRSVEISPNLDRIKQLLQEINGSIKKNDSDFDNRDKKQKEWVDMCWYYMASQAKEEIDKYDTNKKRVDDKISPLIRDAINRVLESIDTRNKEIKKLRSQTINTQEAVENINKTLKGLNFTNFELKEFESSESYTHWYTIVRPGDNSHENVYLTLSEGEKTFISFLYFHQQCLGSSSADEKKKKIIVIDDPISSLDSNTLFIVSTLIRELAQQNKNNKKEFKNQNINQIIILTHNLYFYNEVSRNKGDICTAAAHYYVSKRENNTEIAGPKSDPKKFDSYSLLWEEVKDAKNSVNSKDKDINMVLLNTMCRILESYLSFTGGKENGSWKALEKFDKGTSDYYIASAFLSEINKGSHYTLPTDEISFSSIHKEKLSTYLKVFKKIFEIIGKEHYEMMMGKDSPV